MTQNYLKQKFGKTRAACATCAETPTIYRFEVQHIRATSRATRAACAAKFAEGIISTYSEDEKIE